VHSTTGAALWKNNVRFTEIPQISFSNSEKYLTGLYTSDTSAQKRWNAFLFDCQKSEWATFIDTAMSFENNRSLSNSFKLRVSPNEEQVYFGVWDKPAPEVKDTLLESEKVKLDLWHWKDARIQPQQLVELKEDQSDYNLYVYHIADKRIVQIGQDSLTVRLPSKGNNPYVLATGSKAYEWQTWRTPLPANYYRISTASGEIVPLRYGTVNNTWLSPGGRYFAYYNEKTKQLYASDIEVATETCLTCGVKTNWFEDMNGMPVLESPLGIAGWTANENGVLIQARHGIWYYDLDNSRLSQVTAALTKDTNYRYFLGTWSSDSVYVSPENAYIVQISTKTKAETVYSLAGTFPAPVYTRIAESNHHYTGLKKAKRSETILFQRSSNRDYPDVHAVLRAGETPRQLSVTNPQQSQYNWSSVELIEWKSYEGIPLQGLVYKPENFDPNQSYPMIVYFYELYSDELHNHYAPKPTASIIFPTEYASAGYVVFIPDIRYRTGHPANSAYDCIMSGTDAVLRKYRNINPRRLGLQGQSWGGYQTAQLITMTNRYAAAMAGAPVSNMISAYGGIRWGTGISRQFQYEHTQSRIGKTVWEAPELYIENSPIFHLKKVTTPLLIMANDQDGAVPWYQGIELYTGLRRLQKPVWLLNYNGDDHNLMRNANRFDLSIRMRQFFDYYLLGQAMPLWLKEGIPALQKGKTFKLEVIDEP
jgi:dipeptidyl aminopeptidase/acylaminoacyl peptidase